MKQPSLAQYWTLRYAAGGGPVTQAISQRIGALCAWLTGGLGCSPSAVTLLGSAVFLAGALAYATLPAGWSAAVACGAMFQLAYGLDCADGQLARATARTSAFGAWLDLACDHVRNVLLACAMAHWLARSGVPLGVTLLVAGTFASGLVLKLHALGVKRSQGEPPAERVASPGRRLVVAGFDTAFVLLVVAALRDAPRALALYATAMGLGYGAIGLSQALRQLR